MNPVFTLPPIGLLAEYFWAMDRDDDGRITDSDIFGFLTSCFPDDPFSVALLWSKARSYSSDKDGKLLITSDDSETLIRFLADFSALQNHVPKSVFFFFLIAFLLCVCESIYLLIELITILILIPSDGNRYSYSLICFTKSCLRLIIAFIDRNLFTFYLFTLFYYFILLL